MGEGERTGSGDARSRRDGPRRCGHGQHLHRRPVGAIDRSAVAVALGLALADGATSVTLPVAVRDRIETQQFSAHAKTPIEVPAGKFDATQIDRTDTPGKVMKSWYAGGLLPIRVEQPQHDGAAIVMERK